MSRQDPARARSVAQLCASINAGARAKFIFFWGHRPQPDGQLGPSCFSQWWPARFNAEGVSFASAEHYMMWRKAQLFGDTAMAAAILAAKSPAQAKALGRQIRDFDEPTWVEQRWDIVVSGSVAKFGSDPQLSRYLAKTKRRVLVEASPVDRVWGIGLSRDSEFGEQPHRWRGLNLLGFALMEARDRIASG